MIAPVGVPVLDHPGDDVARLQLHDLGSLGIEVGGVDTPVRGLKPARILATLLINANRRVSVDTLIDAVWGEQVSDSTPGTLESHIWRLRKVLEPHRGPRQEPTFLVNDGGGYRMIVNPDTADSLRFVQLAEQGDRLMATGDPARALRRYELALALWRGRPFDAVADEEWAAAPIARLEELYGQVNEQLAEALLRVGATNRAIRELEDLTGRLPYRERLWILLLTGLNQVGRVEEALAAYHRAREVLIDTLGIEPGAELQDLQRRILDRDPTLARPMPRTDLAEPVDTEDSPRRGHRSGREVHLPTRLAPLVGRAADLEQIIGLVGRHRLVTLTGAAGCGKTRLAIEIARAATNAAPDGVWFVDLTATEDPATISDLVVATIGLEQPPVGTSLTALRSYARDRQLLLLIDNCEHVLPGVYPLLEALLDEDSQCRVLATSREPLGLDGEVLWSLSPLPVREEPGAGHEHPSPAAQLFLARVQSIDPTFRTTPDAAAEVEEICAAVDGIPLAIELAAGRIRSASLAEVREQVSTELAGLSRVGYAQTEHHRTVELSIDWSVRLLPEPDRIVHSRLSVLPGIFTVEAARAVAAGPPVRQRDISDTLTRLAHRSLLAVVPGHSAGQPTRFRQLATVSSHATGALAERGETQQTQDRRTAFIVELIAARPPDHAEDASGWYAAMARNDDTLTAVLQHVIQDRPAPVGVDLVGQLATYWFYQGRISAGLRWSRAALRQPTDPPASPGAVASAELTLACMSALRDRTDQSLRLVNSALAKSDTGVDRRGYAHLLVATAWCVWVRGDQALNFLDDVVRRLAGNDPVIELWAEALAAKTALITDGPAVVGNRAAALAERAEQAGNLSAAWLAAWLRVLCALNNGDADDGLAWLHRVDDSYRRLGGAQVANSVEFAGNFTALTGDHERAAELFGRASRMAFRAGALWPISPATEPVLAAVRHALPRDRFEAAWQAGEALALQTVDPASASRR